LRKPDCQASMEPRRGGRGNRNSRVGILSPEVWLQWSRDAEVAETAGHLGALLKAHKASMEPRRGGRGNVAMVSAPLLLTPSFNGAATRRSRKRAGDYGLPDPKRTGFNGAATRRSRKRALKRRGELLIVVASMEPRRGGRGNEYDAEKNNHGSTASMEPRRGGRGNRHLYGLGGWGGRASMEPRRGGRGNKITSSPCYGRRIASMEPRRGGRGNGASLGHPGEAFAASMEPRRGGRGN